MENKRYKNSRDITRLLRELIQRRLCSGENQLPTERRLSSGFGASRGTLRKAITVLIEEGVLQREGRGIKLVRPFYDLTSCGRILFLAAGIHSAFQQPAMERLWNALQMALLRNRAEVRRLLTEPEMSFDQIRPHLSAADTILLANCNGESSAEVVAFLRENQKKKSVIALLESEVFDLPNLIALDNYAVGAIAADALLDAGSRRPFALWEICDNRDFARRAQGFADKLAAHKRGGIQSIFWLPRENSGMGEGYRARIEWAIEHGYDGVFLMSDEFISDAARSCFAAGLIPEKFKLITVDANRIAFGHTPPVSCVSHATAGIVAEIVEQLQLIAENKFCPIRKLVWPTLYDNGTL